MLHIVPFPHPALRFESKPVLRIDERLRRTVRHMFDAMYDARGIGLAANQVGVPLRFFILNLTADPEQKDKELVFINPEIVKRHSTEENEEGCLSFPGLYSPVLRARRIRVRAYNLQGEEVEYDADDLFGRAIQHETDHLDGKLFVDYLPSAGTKQVEPLIQKIEKKYRTEQAMGWYPSDEEIRARLSQMASDGMADPVGLTQSGFDYGKPDEAGPDAEGLPPEADQDQGTA